MVSKNDINRWIWVAIITTLFIYAVKGILYLIDLIIKKFKKKQDGIRHDVKPENQ
jgi:hypothetical protein